MVEVYPENIANILNIKLLFVLLKEIVFYCFPLICSLTVMVAMETNLKPDVTAYDFDNN